MGILKTFLTRNWQQRIGRRLLMLKAIPLQAWTGLEGARRLRLPDSMITGT